MLTLSISLALGRVNKLKNKILLGKMLSDGMHSIESHRAGIFVICAMFFRRLTLWNPKSEIWLWLRLRRAARVMA